MNIDVDKLSKRLTANAIISDYDFWRTTKIINQALYMAERFKLPIPIDVVRARNIIQQARKRRRDTFY